MTKLMTRAIEEMCRLPSRLQDQVARRLLEDLLPSARQHEASMDSQTSTSEAKTPQGLNALVGLIDRSIDTDAHLAQTRGPAWDPALDGGQ